LSFSIAHVNVKSELVNELIERKRLELV